MNSASPRLAQLAFALIWTTEWVVMVTLGVVAFRDAAAAVPALDRPVEQLAATLQHSPVAAREAVDGVAE